MKFLLTSTIYLLLFAASLQADLPAGAPLLSGKADALTYYGAGDAASIVKIVPVEGQAFDQALQVDSYARKGVQGEAGLTARISTPAKKGDVLWISFKARRLKSDRESGEAFFTIRLDQLVKGKYAWPPYLERGISVSTDWTEVSVPFVIEKDITSEDSRVVILLDTYAQQFEISPITFLNCGPNAKLDELPRSIVHYEGDAPDAPWRAEAAARIEKNRKGDLAIQVLDKAGKPVPGAEIEVRMKRLAFNIGTAITSERVLDKTNPDSLQYQQILTKYFNQVVFENEMKWGKWADKNYKPTQTLLALDWLDKHGITARGHVMVWPSWKKLPAFMFDLKNDPEALKAAIFKHIKEQTDIMKGRFVHWDVTNELYRHHDLPDLLGREEMVKWYEAAHKGDPAVKLFYNEYTMFHADGPGSPSENFFENVKFLKEHGAPIDGIGEQSHIGGTPPPIPLLLERLDKFFTLGLPITITEFDITSNDEDFQARYLHDFMTAIFSHPGTIGIVQWGFWEGQHWLPLAAPWRKDWTRRKHAQAFIDLVKEWRTDAEGATDGKGNYQTRAFCGDYTIKVTNAGKTTEQTVALTNQGQSVTVTLK